ncbi:hypothetical protein QR680_014897 [Steinernema hermaphroditum]|uniref:Uncharacterized protein n=1 Tax=Steinernema hermaphroditum TaxID=289476 RepID=A0AA39IAF0_9BILA|nr:hypothetical protein QR680_014888 [Steinernema hermaphroditum]KAK0420801.1 hypothetical protein QR680_014897 [Steinernema hermaphroditum]
MRARLQLPLLNECIEKASKYVAEEVHRGEVLFPRGNTLTVDILTPAQPRYPWRSSHISMSATGSEVPEDPEWTVVSATDLGNCGWKLLARPTEIAQWKTLMKKIQEAHLTLARRRLVYFRQTPVFVAARSMVDEYQEALRTPRCLRFAAAVPVVQDVFKGIAWSEEHEDDEKDPDPAEESDVPEPPAEDQKPRRNATAPESESPQ